MSASLSGHRPDTAPMRFAGRHVMVTGAASGIGFAAARRFALEGARVSVIDLDASAAAEAAERIESACSELDDARGSHEGSRSARGRAIGFELDVSDAAAVRAAVERLARDVGPIDVLVNNAGIFASAPAHEMPAATWRRVMAVNLDGPLYCAQAAAAVSMIPRRRGAIVNVASTAGLAGIPHAACYVASKHGVVGLTRALAVDWAQYGVRVNAVCPGMTETEMARADRAARPEVFAAREARIPLGRLATPDDQAEGILFLASDDASYLHGHVMPVDGGGMALSSGHTTPRDGA